MVTFLSFSSLTSQWPFTLLAPPPFLRHFLPLTCESPHSPVFPATTLATIHTTSSSMILNTLHALNSWMVSLVLLSPPRNLFKHHLWDSSTWISEWQLRSNMAKHYFDSLISASSLIFPITHSFPTWKLLFPSFPNPLSQSISKSDHFRLQ